MRHSVSAGRLPCSVSLRFACCQFPLSSSNMAQQSERRVDIPRLHETAMKVSSIDDGADTSSLASRTTSAKTGNILSRLSRYTILTATATGHAVFCFLFSLCIWHCKRLPTAVASMADRQFTLPNPSRTAGYKSTGRTANYCYEVPGIQQSILRKQRRRRINLPYLDHISYQLQHPQQRSGTLQIVEQASQPNRYVGIWISKERSFLIPQPKWRSSYPFYPVSTALPCHPHTCSSARSPRKNQNQRRHQSHPQKSTAGIPQWAQYLSTRICHQRTFFSDRGRKKSHQRHQHNRSSVRWLFCQARRRIWVGRRRYPGTFGLVEAKDVVVVGL